MNDRESRHIMLFDFNTSRCTFCFFLLWHVETVGLLLGMSESVHSRVEKETLKAREMDGAFGMYDKASRYGVTAFSNVWSKIV